MEFLFFSISHRKEHRVDVIVIRCINLYYYFRVPLMQIYSLYRPNSSRSIIALYSRTGLGLHISQLYPVRFFVKKMIQG